LDELEIYIWKRFIQILQSFEITSNPPYIKRRYSSDLTIMNNQSCSKGTPNEAGGEARKERKIRVISLLNDSGKLANILFTHSVFPMLTKNKVKIINGKGATWSI
jgi:hypothetical protein